MGGGEPSKGKGGGKSGGKGKGGKGKGKGDSDGGDRPASAPPGGRGGGGGSGGGRGGGAGGKGGPKAKVGDTREMGGVTLVAVAKDGQIAWEPVGGMDSQASRDAQRRAAQDEARSLRDTASAIKDQRVAEARDDERKERQRKAQMLGSDAVYRTSKARGPLIPVPKLLVETRLEEENARNMGMPQSAPKQYQFVKESLDALERDYATKEQAARGQAYERNRRKLRIGGQGDSGADEDEGEEEEDLRTRLSKMTDAEFKVLAMERKARADSEVAANGAAAAGGRGGVAGGGGAAGGRGGGRGARQQPLGPKDDPDFSRRPPPPAGGAALAGGGEAAGGGRGGRGGRSGRGGRGTGPPAAAAESATPRANGNGYQREALTTPTHEHARTRHLPGTCPAPARHLPGTCSAPARHPLGTCSAPARHQPYALHRARRSGRGGRSAKQLPLPPSEDPDYRR
jgi:hypothetical protein